MRVPSLRPVGAAMIAVALTCAAAASPARAEAAGAAAALVAILPLDNLTGRQLDAAPVGDALRAALSSRGIAVLDNASLRRVLDAHRVRYTGGVAPDLAAAFRSEAGVTGILVTSVESFEEGGIPALGMTVRLVSTEERPRILWMDGAGMTGEDRPGFLDLGVVTDPGVLVERTAAKLADALAGALARTPSKPQRAERRFQPRADYAHAGGLPGTTPLRIAVLPFTNRSSRRNAGEVLALHFVHRLSGRSNVEVVEPGVVRDILLRMRLIPEGGIPYSQAELLKEVLGADLVLHGEVLDYIDVVGEDQVPVVDFMIQLLDPARRTLSWTSFNHGTGSDRVWWFQKGRIRSAARLSSAMALATVDRFLKQTSTSAVRAQ